MVQTCSAVLRSFAWLLSALLGLVIGLAMPAWAQYGRSPTVYPSVTIEGTHFVVIKSDGTHLEGKELVNAVVVLSVNGAGTALVRIDDVEREPNKKDFPKSDLLFLPPVLFR